MLLRAARWTEAGDIVQDNLVDVPVGTVLGFDITNGALTTGSRFEGNSYNVAGGCGTRAWKQLSGTRVPFTSWQSAGEDSGGAGTCQS